MLLCRVTFGAMKTERVKNHTNIRKVHKGHMHSSMIKQSTRRAGLIWYLSMLQTIIYSKNKNV